ncbi:MAG TPA: hypothetical protein VE604_16820 [Candidatus Polarisedimenticolia bacterium]|nr:hypothetical protein [Candidatus Polarisedimenticolia bacterium]
MELHTPNIEPDIPEGLRHPAIHRRILIRSDSPEQLQRAEIAEILECKFWIIQKIVEPLDEIS